MGRAKQRTFEILQIPSAPEDVPGRVFDAFIIVLICLNVAAVLFESVGDNHATYAWLLQPFETISLIVFAAEYALRVWSVTADPAYASPVAGRLRFIASPYALIDLLAIAPVLLTAFLVLDLRFLRVVRLLRLLKLTKYSESTVILGRVLRSRRQALGTALFVVLIALFIVSSLMYFAEHEAQPDKFSSIPASMWWGVVALTTTGYGDVVPVTALGQVLGGLTAVVGVGVIALPVGILASGFIEELDKAKAQRVTVKPAVPTACPHCGKQLVAPTPSGGKAEAQSDAVPHS